VSLRGVHLPYRKATGSKTIEPMSLPDMVVLPLRQHTGASCEPVVSKGDEVLAGQIIGKSTSLTSAQVHASISGIVKRVSGGLTPAGYLADQVVIERDKKDRWVKLKESDPTDLGGKEIIDKIKDAGVVDSGVAALPAHVKLIPPTDRPVDTLIVNGAEWEPGITCDHRLMLERGEDIIKGVEITMMALGVNRAIVGIERHRTDAIAKIREIASGSEADIDVVKLKMGYPQGAEKILVYSLLRREVPIGGSPLDRGAIVLNVGTLRAIYEAVRFGKPMVERVVTVTGAIREPKDLSVRIGTKMKDAISACGGYLGEPGKVINGGPMTGIAQPNDEVPIIKGTSAVLVQSGKEVDRWEREERPCIKCGSCIDHCPVGLMPLMIVAYAKKGRFEECNDYSIMNCFECGCCSYVCPSNIPLVHWIQYGKNEIAKRGGEEG